MLVLIVVSAAIAFSLFLAAEEKITISQRSANQQRALENLSVEGLTLAPTVTLLLSSSSIENTSITGIVVDGDPIAYYCLGIGACSGPAIQWFPVAGPNGSDLAIPAFSLMQINVSNFYQHPFQPSANKTVVLISTLRGNDFVDTFLSPVAKLGVEYITGWPLLDGTGSYQPSEKQSANASIISWNWLVQRVHSTGILITDNDTADYSGEESELPSPFVRGATYWINLTVTNTFGLTGTTDELFTAPGPALKYVLNFTETGLPVGTTWKANADNSSESSSLPSILFYVSNGTYSFSVPTVGSQSANPSSSPPPVSIMGVGQTVDLTFS